MKQIKNCELALFGSPPLAIEAVPLTWFSEENISLSISSVSKMLDEEALINWTSKYDFKSKSNKSKVFIIMAGNLPLVGFHDFLSVLISGNIAFIKLSSKDNILPKILIEIMISIDSRIADFINIVDNIIDLNIDAVIATGSDNSSKYFNYYFKGFKSIIRKNRRSVAILDGSESVNQLESLAVDVFSYFGLGCRSVSKIYIPTDYDLNKLFTDSYFADMASSISAWANPDIATSLVVLIDVGEQSKIN